MILRKKENIIFIVETHHHAHRYKNRVRPRLKHADLCFVNDFRLQHAAVKVTGVREANSRLQLNHMFVVVKTG